MSATTKDLKIVGKNFPEPVAFPVKSGETIYQGSIVVVGKDGYLYDYDSTSRVGAVMIGICADGPYVDPVAATTASGSISGTNQKQSAVSGDKTVRRVYLGGKFQLTASSITQAMVGHNMYAVDNQTFDETFETSNVCKLGKLITYLSATSGIVEIDPFISQDGSYVIGGTLTSSTGDNGGELNIANPMARTLLIEELYLNVTTAATAATTLNIGVGATAADNDSLLDAVSIAATGWKSIAVNGGTNGNVDEWASSEYITGTKSLDESTAVVEYLLKFRPLV